MMRFATQMSKHRALPLVVDARQYWRVFEDSDKKGCDVRQEV